MNSFFSVVQVDQISYDLCRILPQESHYNVIKIHGSCDVQRSLCEEIVDIVNKSGTKKYEQCSICIYFLICAIKISASSCEWSVKMLRTFQLHCLKIWCYHRRPVGGNLSRSILRPMLTQGILFVCEMKSPILITLNQVSSQTVNYIVSVLADLFCRVFDFSETDQKIYQITHSVHFAVPKLFTMSTISSQKLLRK